MCLPLDEQHFHKIALKLIMRKTEVWWYDPALQISRISQNHFTCLAQQTLNSDLLLNYAYATVTCNKSKARALQNHLMIEGIEFGKEKEAATAKEVEKSKEAERFWYF